MKRFIQGEHRGQGTLLPESLNDYVSELIRCAQPMSMSMNSTWSIWVLKVPSQPMMAGLLTTPRSIASSWCG